eukprot:6187711-Pleurochrysis_carterae.AAC.2
MKRLPVGLCLKVGAYGHPVHLATLAVHLYPLGDGAPPGPRSFCSSFVITTNLPTQNEFADIAGGARRSLSLTRDTIARHQSAFWRRCGFYFYP